MAVEIKLIFGAISILLGLIWISGFNGLITDRFDQYNLRTASDSFFSNSETLKYAEFNSTRVNREIQRNPILNRVNRSNYRIGIPRNSFNLNLRSYFLEKNSRNEDVSSRNRRIEQLGFRNFDFDRRQRNAPVRKIELGRRERISDDFQERSERLPFVSSEWTRLDEKKIYRNELRDMPLFLEQYRSSFRREHSRIEMMEDRRSSRNERTPQRKVMARLMGNNFKNFFQYIWDWGSLINYALTGISSYLFTIVAGLFIFDTVGQLIPVKPTEGKGFLSVFRNFASITGNVMAH